MMECGHFHTTPKLKNSPKMNYVGPGVRAFKCGSAQLSLSLPRGVTMLRAIAIWTPVLSLGG